MKLSNEEWLEKLKKKLKKSRENLTQHLSFLISRVSTFEEHTWENVEEVLIKADVGVSTTIKLVSKLKEKVKTGELTTPQEIFECLKKELATSLKREKGSFYNKNNLNILLIVGVNGTGKTTTIAKMAHQAKQDGLKPVLCVSDTFRAAAIEQLGSWADKLGVDCISQKRGSDPSAVVFDAVHAALSRKADLLLIDTAGRLHTYLNLMEELKKTKRIIKREAPKATLKTLLVIDATTGHNGVAQAKTFHEILGIDGIILTKLDGTAKGGIVVTIQNELEIPIEFIGIGEGLDDLREFNPDEFTEALLSS
ncbi:MAG: signal recognition particle-docking protein FtsY [Candidatus Subteraquimicrobiales bacterium]|nr:signal recognition particle-docking protein FtsY [Candidatus Subteraquimicrobiales bacterium]